MAQRRSQVQHNHAQGTHPCALYLFVRNFSCAFLTPTGVTVFCTLRPWRGSAFSIIFRNSAASSSAHTRHAGISTRTKDRRSIELNHRAYDIPSKQNPASRRSISRIEDRTPRSNCALRLVAKLPMPDASLLEVCISREIQTHKRIFHRHGVKQLRTCDHDKIR